MSQRSASAYLAKHEAAKSAAASKAAALQAKFAYKRAGEAKMKQEADAAAAARAAASPRAEPTNWLAFAAAEPGGQGLSACMGKLTPGR